MDWMENLLIIAGVSLDIFAAMECQGSLVAKINKKNNKCKFSTKKMQESTKNPSFIPATHFYNDFKRIYPKIRNYHPIHD